MTTFILARTGAGRPTLQHVLREDNNSLTECGTDVTFWSWAYQAQAIPQIICKKCAKKVLHG
jgi:hypothetical protein